MHSFGGQSLAERPSCAAYPYDRTVMQCEMCELSGGEQGWILMCGHKAEAKLGPQTIIIDRWTAIVSTPNLVALHKRHIKR